MILQILKHDWLAFKRNPLWRQSAAIYIVLGIFGLYIIATLFSIGYMSQNLLDEFFPDQDPTVVISRFMIYYLLGDWVARYMLQKFPNLAIKRYLTQNISRSSISHFLSTRSLFSFFNLAPLFLFIPVYLKTIVPNTDHPLPYLLMMIMLIFISHYFVMYVDRYFGKNWKVSALIIAILSTSAMLDYRGLISLGEIFLPIFLYLGSNFIGPLILLAITCVLYFLNYNLLRDHARIDDDLLRISGKEVTSKNYVFFDRFRPEIGRIMELDFKLLLRNKRTKSFLFASLIFVFYPFLLTRDMGEFDSYGFLLFVGTFIVGSFTLNIGQVMFSINSGHFEQILCHRLNLKDYINAKYTLLAVANLGLFILTLPYGFINTKFILTNAAMCLFVTGIVIYGYMYLGLKYSKKFEINKGGMFNMQGFGAAHFVVMIPIMAFPILLYLPFGLSGYPLVGVLMIALAGLLGIVLKDKFINKALNSLQVKKYEMNANFKK